MACFLLVETDLAERYIGATSAYSMDNQKLGTIFEALIFRCGHEHFEAHVIEIYKSWVDLRVDKALGVQMENGSETWRESQAEIEEDIEESALGDITSWMKSIDEAAEKEVETGRDREESVDTMDSILAGLEDDLDFGEEYETTQEEIKMPSIATKPFAGALNVPALKIPGLALGSINEGDESAESTVLDMHDSALRERLVPDFALHSARAIEGEKMLVRMALEGVNDEADEVLVDKDIGEGGAPLTQRELAFYSAGVVMPQDGNHLWGESQEDRKDTVLNGVNRLTWAGSRCTMCGAMSVKRSKVQYVLGLPVCPESDVREWISDYNGILQSIGADEHGLGKDSITPKELRCFEFLQPKAADNPPCTTCHEPDEMTKFICSKQYRCKQPGCSLRKLCKEVRWYCKRCADESFRPPVVTMKLSADGDYVEDGLLTAREQSGRDAEQAAARVGMA